MWLKKRREAVRFTSQLFGWFQGVEGSGTSVAVWKGCRWPTRTGWLKLSWGFRLYLDISSQYSCLENPMDAGAWWAAVRGVAKCRTQLSDFTFTFTHRAVAPRWRHRHYVHSFEIYLLSTCSVADPKEDKEAVCIFSYSVGQRLANSIKGQIINILGFAGLTVFVVTSQLCIVKAAFVFQ